MSLDEIRARLAGASGPRFWRSLEEAADDPHFRAALAREFPSQVPFLDAEVSRRGMLKVMGASLALAGLSACGRQPLEMIVPYHTPPERLVPGRPLLFATAIPRHGHARGVLVESQMGRPIKVEGHPHHPDSLGATDAVTQAAVLSLYDPDRSRTVTRRGGIEPLSACLVEARGLVESLRSKGGEGFRILVGATTSPTLAAQIEALRAALPALRVHVYDPLGRANAAAGARIALGRPLDLLPRLEEADVVVALECDLLAEGPAALRCARAFAARRRPDSPRPMNRLYAVESTPTLTGAAADHRWPLAPARLEAVVRALAAACGVGGAGAPDLPAEDAARVETIAADLRAARGRALVAAGEPLPAHLHALVHALNESLGAYGATADLVAPALFAPEDAGGIADLCEAMRAGAVEGLLVLGGNPAYDAPAEAGFAEAVGRVRVSIRLGMYEDETSAACLWHVPEAHPLESWSDLRASDGTATILQPLVEPLGGGVTVHQFLAGLSGEAADARAIVRARWKDLDEAAWRRALHDGVVEGTAHRPEAARVRLDDVRRALAAAPPSATEGLVALFRPDAHVGAGEGANNAWLQEAPRPLTRLAWENAVLLAPRDAERMGLRNGDEVEAAIGPGGGRSVRAPVWILPGQAEGCATIHLGYGRRRGGRVLEGVGFDAYTLRPAGAWAAAPLALRPTGHRRDLACTQDHSSMEGRDLVRVAALPAFLADPGVFGGPGEEPPSLYAEAPREEGEHAWAMSIDLNACIGCGACTVACQAENNVPVVGRDQVARGREMHWIRVDRYFEGGLDDPAVLHQPVPCMHCEKAPCEPVCPVGATVHSAEGLNEMVYNRCVGTRYCANNCPYKVRRFNFYAYADREETAPAPVRNPDVTVRSRGVMEKCTYCVQRIEEAKIAAKREDRPLRDGDVVTACEAVCPTRAIVFGDLRDPESRVSKARNDARSYGLLAELGTRPRTTYMGRVRNPNPRFP